MPHGVTSAVPLAGITRARALPVRVASEEGDEDEEVGDGDDNAGPPLMLTPE